jgi:uncharacterized protein (DUF488 family)
MRLFTIGFTKSSAERFFTRLQRGPSETTRGRKAPQRLTTRWLREEDDLRYFLKAICAMEYIHRPELAPTDTMLDDYKKLKGDWSTYERRFLDLMATRRIEETVPQDALADACLLCSEDKPHHCHRRLVAEYLKGKWGNVEIVHL